MIPEIFVRQTCSTTAPSAALPRVPLDCHPVCSAACNGQPTVSCGTTSVSHKTWPASAPNPVFWKDQSVTLAILQQGSL
jgi:hypothetical protein